MVTWIHSVTKRISKVWRICRALAKFSKPIRAFRNGHGQPKWQVLVLSVAFHTSVIYLSGLLVYRAASGQAHVLSSVGTDLCQLQLISKVFECACFLSGEVCYRCSVQRGSDPAKQRSKAARKHSAGVNIEG